MAGGRGNRRIGHVAGAVMLALATVVAGVPIHGSGPVQAGGEDRVRCPKRIGGLRNAPSAVGAGETGLQCFYTTRRVQHGTVRVAVAWRPDTPEARSRCVSRVPVPVDGTAGGPEAFNRSLQHPERGASGTYHVTEGSRVSRDQAEAALRAMLGSAAALAHPCVPEPDAPAPGALECPLVLGDRLVRADWYGDPVPHVEPIGDPADQRWGFACRYWHAYQDEGDLAVLRMDWLERGPADPLAATICRADRRDQGVVIITDGRVPVTVRVDPAVLEAGGESLITDLLAAAGARTTPCDASRPGAGVAPTPRLVTIVVSGSAEDVRPLPGEPIVLPADERHGLVIGGPDATVLREEFLGDAGTVTSVGAIATLADGRWSALVTLEVTPPAGGGPDASPVPSGPPSPGAAPAGSPAPAGTPAPAVSPAPAGSPAGPDLPARTPAPASTAVPSPPAATIPADQAAGAVTRIADHVDALGRSVARDGTGTAFIPAADLEALVALAPDVVVSVRSGAGSILVATELGDIVVTPDVSPDGGLQVHLSRFAWATSLPVVQGLLRALNGGLAEHGTRVAQIAVRPEGIEIRAVRANP